MKRIGTIAAAITLVALPVSAFAADPESGEADAAATAVDTETGPPDTAANSAASEGSTDAGSVARAQVTSAVVDREPQDSVDRVSGEVASLAYFTELHGLEGQTVTHVWEFQGNEMARVSFPVGAPRWRVHSTKRLDASWVGAWRVSVVDQNGAELRSDHFYYAAKEAANVAKEAANVAEEAANVAEDAAATGEAPPAAAE